MLKPVKYDAVVIGLEHPFRIFCQYPSRIAVGFVAEA